MLPTLREPRAAISPAFSMRKTGLWLLPLLLGLALPAHATIFTVTSNADTAGATCAAGCTLRQAITAANADAAAVSTINFNIPGTGVHRITIDAILPNVNHTTTINGYTQPGSRPNSLASGDDRVILIELTASTTLADGLFITADNCTVKGLAVFGFTSGIRIGSSASNSANNSTISGNFIGLSADGTTDMGFFGGSGVAVSAANNSVVGGLSPASRNVIAGYFGGVRSFGVNIANVAMNVTVINNYIGTDAQGVLDRGNGTAVLIASGASGWTVGNDASPNLLAFSGGGGAEVFDAGNNNRVFANDYVKNQNSGIDLAEANLRGNTPNDADDADTGPNNLQNFPVVATAVQNYGTVVLTGALDVPHTPTVVVQNFTIGLYSSGACHSSGRGPGELYLGSRPAGLIDGGAILTEGFTLSLTARPPRSSKITATATDSNGNTSEFSSCVTLTQGDGIFEHGFEAVP
ncbi:MAG: CSLREA domain-containing protein [Tahibacter sp.]